MTVVIAWLALAMAVMSLGWQVTSWRRTGARLRVDIHTCATKEGEITGFVVLITNVGRLVGNVHEVALFPNDTPAFLQFSPTATRGEKAIRESQITSLEALQRARIGSLPARIEPGDEVEIWFPIDEIIAATDSFGINFWAVVVRVRSGRKIVFCHGLSTARHWTEKAKRSAPD